MNSKDKDQLKINPFFSNVVDLSYLNESLGGNKEMLQQLTELFLSQNPDKIELLKKSIEEKKFEEIRETAHFLKSSFTIMGLQCKSELIEIEELSKEQKQLDRIDVLSKIVFKNYEESVEEYNKIISAL